MAHRLTDFCRLNGVVPVKTPPYHPQSNGLAERGVQTVKRQLEKQMFEQKSVLSINQQLTNFLLSYRNTPSVVTGITPAEMIFKFKPRTRLDLLKLVFCKPYTNPLDNGGKPILKRFSVGDRVFVRNVRDHPKWDEGIVVKSVSLVTYLVDVNCKTRFCHADDMRNRGC